VIYIWGECERDLPPPSGLNDHLIGGWIGRGEIRVEVDVPPHPVCQLQGPHTKAVVMEGGGVVVVVVAQGCGLEGDGLEGGGLEGVGVVVVVMEGGRLELHEGLGGRGVIQDKDSSDLLGLNLLQSSGCLAGRGGQRVELAKQLLVLHLEFGFSCFHVSSDSNYDFATACDNTQH